MERTKSVLYAIFIGSLLLVVAIGVYVNALSH
jgi:hypothetical protein